MTRRRRSEVRRARRWIALAALGALGMGGLALQVRSSHAARTWFGEKMRAPRFHLEAVEFIGLEKLAPAELLELAGLDARMPLIDLDLLALLERLSSHPRVASCIAARIPPHRLVVEIEERVPVARLAGRNEGVAHDGARFPLLRNEGEGLPSLRGEVKWALPLLRAARELGVELAEVEVRSRNDLRFRPADHAVRVRIGSDADMSLRAWLRLRSSGLLQRHAARQVDLRFRGSAVLREFRN